MYVYSRVWHHLRWDKIIDHSKFRNFTSSWEMAKATIKLCRRFIFHKINRKNAKKTTDEFFCTFAGMTLLTPNSELCNFITSGQLIKTPQNFVQSSFFHKIIKNIPQKQWWVFCPRSPSVLHEFWSYLKQTCQFTGSLLPLRSTQRTLNKVFTLEIT